MSKKPSVIWIRGPSSVGLPLAASSDSRNSSLLSLLFDKIDLLYAFSPDESSWSSVKVKYISRKSELSSAEVDLLKESVLHGFYKPSALRCVTTRLYADTV